MSADKSYNTKWITIGISIVTFLSTVVGSAFAIDARYARIKDLEMQKAAIEFAQKVEIKDIKKTILRNDIKKIETKVFELEFKQSESELKPLEKALLERYKRDLELLQKQLKELK